MKSFEFYLFADYFQFYLRDAVATGDLSRAWSEEAVGRLLAIAPGAIGVGTVRNMTVPVTLEIHDDEPTASFVEWDHVVEAGLNVTSGQILIAGCTDYLPDATRIEVLPGTYRVRVSYGALNAMSGDHLSGDDHYRVQLWAAPFAAARILKQRPK
jgi:hypothetical protein